MNPVSFSCRLPISYSISIGATPTESAFIAFPSTTINVDPTGKGGGCFDRAFSRWLPVTRAAVSPVGKHYAYVNLGDPDIFYVHVVDVASGIDHALHEDANAAGISFSPFVLDYAAEGIYLSQGFESAGGGLWLVNPTTGSIRQVSRVGHLLASAGGGIFWASEINPAEPNPVNTRSSRGTLPNQIDRLDLKTGSLTPWLYLPGSGLTVAGIDLRGRPLIVAEHAGDDPAAELLIVIDATAHCLVQRGDVVYGFREGIADSHGVWFGSPVGIYLHSDALGLQKVSAHPRFPANGCC